MVKPGLKHIVEIIPIEVKSAYRYEACEYCAFHEVEPGVCEDCDDADQFEEMKLEQEVV